MKDLRNWLAAGAFTILVGWIVFASVGQARALQRTTDALAAERTARLASEAEALGYSVALEAAKGEAAAKDSIAKELEASLRRAEARLAVRVTATAESKLDTVFIGDVISPVEVVASVDHEPFTGSVRFVAPDSFYLKLLAAPRIELYVINAADGSFLASARPLSPNTLLHVEPLDIPIPQQEPEAKGVRWYHLPLAVLAGAVGGAVTWEFAR